MNDILYDKKLDDHYKKYEHLNVPPLIPPEKYDLFERPYSKVLIDYTIKKINENGNITIRDLKLFDIDQSIFKNDIEILKRVRRLLLNKLREYRIIENVKKGKFIQIEDPENTNIYKYIDKKINKNYEELTIIKEIAKLQKRGIIWGIETLSKRLKMKKDRVRSRLKKLKLTNCLYREYRNKKTMQIKTGGEYILDFYYKLHPKYKEYIEMWYVN